MARRHNAIRESFMTVILVVFFIYALVALALYLSGSGRGERNTMPMPKRKPFVRGQNVDLVAEPYGLSGKMISVWWWGITVRVYPVNGGDRSFLLRFDNDGNQCGSFFEFGPFFPNDYETSLGGTWHLEHPFVRETTS
jgi:hypothetical protein